ALARLAPPALHVERESPRPIPADLRFGEHRVELPDGCEEAGVRRRVGTRRPADGTLIDVDHLVDLVEPLEPLVDTRHHLRPVEMARESLVEDVGDEGGLAGTR